MKRKPRENVSGIRRHGGGPSARCARSVRFALANGIKIRLIGALINPSDDADGADFAYADRCLPLVARQLARTVVIVPVQTIAGVDMQCALAKSEFGLRIRNLDTGISK